MKEKKYVRKDNVITTVETKKQAHFKSIALAKKESRRLQLEEDGALGRGSVRLMP